ncbi:MAG: amidohydrolase [Acidimicrobiales bacterium]
MSLATDWVALYRDLHRHPELGFEERRTAGLVAEHLRAAGFEVEEGVGTTGVVGVLRNGEGPTVLVRADMDALPVTEKTGLDYASEVPGVAHACGHDVHTTCLLAACHELAETKETWRGTLLAVFQPAEELGIGAKAMLDDGLYDRHGTPIVVLGQHVAPLPAGTVGLHAGASFSALDRLDITLHGVGGHGSQPQTTVDPVVMAASTVMKLQTVVARETSPSDFAVVTVGKLTAGTKANIIPDEANLEVTIRSYRDEVRQQVLASIDRIVRGEAAAAGAPKPPDVLHVEAVDAVHNDPAACAATQPALASTGVLVVDPGPVPGSEDVGCFATAAGAPCVYWLLGGADPVHFEGLTSLQEFADRVRTLPSNHSPEYAPVTDPTIRNGIAALVAAARHWLPTS